MDKKNTNVIGQLRIMKDLNIKPNFSAIAREYEMDRHTVKKYYDNDGIPKRKNKTISSQWDRFKEEMDSILENPAVSYKALYMFMLHKYGEGNLPSDYNSLRNYYYASGRRMKAQNKPHVLYETPPGKQAQFDWKEDLLIHLMDGKEIRFNVFSLTLSYSREHIFIYSSGKRLDDFLHSFIKAINKLGGVTQEFLTDNMSAIVSVKGRNKKIHPKVLALFKDIGSKLKLCKVRTPETKGKDENANKFISWIYPYDYKLKSENELIELIEETITSDANCQINTSTNMPPSALFSKEKEYLRPLSHKILLESYLDEHISQVVPPTLLINYKGHKYSVSSEYISKKVDIYEIGDRLNIYYNSKLIAIHNISQDRINYLKEHYIEGLSGNISLNQMDDIEKMASENLKRLKVLGKDNR